MPAYFNLPISPLIKISAKSAENEQENWHVPAVPEYPFMNVSRAIALSTERLSTTFPQEIPRSAAAGEGSSATMEKLGYMDNLSMDALS